MAHGTAEFRQDISEIPRETTEYLACLNSDAPCRFCSLCDNPAGFFHEPRLRKENMRCMSRCHGMRVLMFYAGDDFRFARHIR